MILHWLISKYPSSQSLEVTEQNLVIDQDQEQDQDGKSECTYGVPMEVSWKV